MKTINFFDLLRNFLTKMESKKLTQSSITSFAQCNNIEKLIGEVSYYIAETEGDKDKAATYILSNLF
jgi:hypothetical protein